MQDFPLADEFFLANHAVLTGKPTLRRDLLSCGLVVALLAELIMAGRVVMRDGKVSVLDEAARGDDATDFVVASLAAQWTPHTVWTWTGNLDDTAYELVARRLVDRGTVRRVRPWRLGSRKELFPTAKREGIQPFLLLEGVLKDPNDADLQRAVLATLVSVAGAQHALAGGLDRDRVRSAIAQLRESLPADLAELAAGFEEAVTVRLLSIRR